ncbi:MAG: gamma carbonic anhydrase family protein [Leptospira sp.]|nr:gamma carbonic anhydrase family protein [Leptospira sp.]
MLSKQDLPFFESPFIHPQATSFGMTEYGGSVSIWPGAVIRADMNVIRLGNYVNIQDNSTLHTDSTSSISIGDWTLVGHNVMLHGCKIGKAVLIGIGSIVLDKAEIGDGCQIAAGCMIRGGKKIPPRSLVVPNNGDIKIYPGKAKPELTIAGCIEYAHLALRYQKGIFQPFTKEEEVQFLQLAKEILIENKI